MPTITKRQKAYADKSRNENYGRYNDGDDNNNNPMISSSSSSRSTNNNNNNNNNQQPFSFLKNQKICSPSCGELLRGPLLDFAHFIRLVQIMRSSY